MAVSLSEADGDADRSSVACAHASVGSPGAAAVDRHGFKVCLSKQALSVWRVRVLSDCYFRIHSTSRRSRRLQLQVESSTFVGRRARSVTSGCDTDFCYALGSHMVGSMSAARKIRGESRESAACTPCVEGSNQLWRELWRPGPRVHVYPGSWSTLLFAKTTSHRGNSDGMRVHSGRMGCLFWLPLICGTPALSSAMRWMRAWYSSLIRYGLNLNLREFLFGI
jgi:hypothetical protein